MSGLEKFFNSEDFANPAIVSASLHTLKCVDIGLL